MPMPTLFGDLLRRLFLAIRDAWRVCAAVVAASAVLLGMLLSPAVAWAQADTEAGAAESRGASDADAESSDDQTPLAERPWVRAVETEDRVVQLQVAVRRFKPMEGDGPTLTVAGAVHVADRPFYEQLQEMLDVKDLVLFEGVKPAGAEQTPPRTTGEAVQRTEDRLRMVGTFLTQTHRHAEEHGHEAPMSLDELAAYLREHGMMRPLNWLGAVDEDGWGEPLVVVMKQKTEGDAFDVVSYGADGKPGGDGADADLRFSDQPALAPEETGEAPGVQARLAEVLRLTFQLDEMDESGENWRSADMTMSEVRDRIRELGGDPDVLFGQLQGTGLSGTLVNFLLTMIDVMPGAPPRVKLMMIEMLQHADDLLKSEASPLGREVLQVIIEERNQVIMDELLPVLESEAAEKGWDDIAIIYGAGHMKDLVDRLAVQAGYEPVQGDWLSAISLDMNRYGISPFEHAMIKRQLEMQLNAMRNQGRR